MKNATQWAKEFSGEAVPFIRAIQADALRHAARMCETKGNKCEGEGTCCCYGARDAIEAEAAKLERPQ